MTNANPAGIAGVSKGNVLAGKYLVEGVLGVGGMGVVVAARHLQLETRVAIKFLQPAMLGNQEAVDRFAREARAAVKIRSEHVARVLDVGTLDHGPPYMVMEFLEGIDLSAWLRQHGPMPVGQAVEFVLQACEAIAEAHSLGIVHRDLKPANLFCIRRADGLLAIKVLDFGISKIEDDENPGVSVTRTAAVVGSPRYMSPEQLKSSKDVDMRTDIWSLGVMLHELLTGAPPFGESQSPAVYVAIATEPAPRLRQILPSAPKGLEAVLLRCLEKDRANRFADVAEFARALQPFGPPQCETSVARIARTIEAAGLSRAPVTGNHSGQTGSGIVAAPSAEGGWLPAGSRRVALATVLGVFVLSAAGYAAFRRSHGPAAAVDPSSLSPPPTTQDSPPAAAESPPTSASPAPTAPGTGSAGTEDTQPTVPATGATGATGASPSHTPHIHSRTNGAGVPTATLPGCDPPFVLDSEGRKHFKPECFLSK